MCETKKLYFGLIREIKNPVFFGVNRLQISVYIFLVLKCFETFETHAAQSRDSRDLSILVVCSKSDEPEMQAVQNIMPRTMQMSRSPESLDYSVPGLDFETENLSRLSWVSSLVVNTTANLLKILFDGWNVSRHFSMRKKLSLFGTKNDGMAAACSFHLQKSFEFTYKFHWNYYHDSVSPPRLVRQSQFCLVSRGTNSFKKTVIFNMDKNPFWLLSTLSTKKSFDFSWPLNKFTHIWPHYSPSEIHAASKNRMAFFYGKKKTKIPNFSNIEIQALSTISSLL